MTDTLHSPHSSTGAASFVNRCKWETFVSSIQMRVIATWSLLSSEGVMSYFWKNESLMFSM